MDFKETYKKYLDGTATDEEKVFVEAEIEKARLVNSEVIAASKSDKIKPEENVKPKKKKTLRQTIKTIIISVVVVLVVFLIAFATIYGVSVSNALDNIKIEPEQAKEKAVEFTYIYARDHYGYAGSMEMLVADQEPDTREMIFKIPLSKCHYVYEYEFLAGNMDFDVQVNSATGMCSIVDIDKID